MAEFAWYADLTKLEELAGFLAPAAMTELLKGNFTVGYGPKDSLR